MMQRENVKDLPGYNVWTGVRTRCYNPQSKDFRYYGARGIQCLLTYEEFCDVYFGSDQCQQCGTSFEVVERTIDRIDNDGYYNLSNCQVLCRGCNCSKARKQEVGKFVGENARHRKLTQNEVQRMRKLFKRLRGKRRIPLQKMLAVKFGVSPACVSNVVRGKNWRK
jgi:hypothetical protein